MDQLKNVLRQYRILLVLILEIILVSFLSDAFLTLTNLMIVIRQVSMTAIIAAGMTVVIITAGIDLSVGSIVALSGAMGAGFMASSHSVIVGVAVSLATGAIIGLANGLLITKQDLPPFIVTLATMVGIRGLTLVYTQGNPVIVSEPSFAFIGGGVLLGIPVPIIIMVLVFVLVHVLLKYTRFGRYVYAIGGNEEAARLSGVSNNKIKILVYTLSGLVAGLSGLILTSRLASAQPTAGNGWELDAIAAVILGGTSLMGGSGGVAGTLYGALILGIISNALNLLNVSPFYQGVVTAIIIIVAVVTDSRLSKMAAKRSIRRQS